jgi:hypothetical protein
MPFPEPRSEITREVCDAARAHLGMTATPSQVAKYLKCGPNTVRRRYTIKEQRKWTALIRKARREAAIDRAARKVLSVFRRTGKLPLAHDSGVTTNLMNAAGGYNAIVKRAGLLPRKPGRPRKGALPLLQPPPPKVKHWQGPPLKKG